MTEAKILRDLYEEYIHWEIVLRTELIRFPNYGKPCVCKKRDRRWKHCMCLITNLSDNYRLTANVYCAICGGIRK